MAQIGREDGEVRRGNAGPVAGLLRVAAAEMRGDALDGALPPGEPVRLRRRERLTPGLGCAPELPEAREADGALMQEVDPALGAQPSQQITSGRARTLEG